MALSHQARALGHKSNGSDTDSYINAEAVLEKTERAKMLFCKRTITDSDELEMIVVSGKEGVVFGERIADMHQFKDDEVFLNLRRLCNSGVGYSAHGGAVTGRQYSNMYSPAMPIQTTSDVMLLLMYRQLELQSNPKRSSSWLPMSVYTKQSQSGNGRMLTINVADIGELYDINIIYWTLKLNRNQTMLFSTAVSDIVDYELNWRIIPLRIFKPIFNQLQSYLSKMTDNDSKNILSFLTPPVPRPDMSHVVIHRSLPPAKNEKAKEQTFSNEQQPVCARPSVALSAAQAVQQPTKAESMMSSVRP